MKAVELAYSLSKYLEGAEEIIREYNKNPEDGNISVTYHRDSQTDLDRGIPIVQFMPWAIRIEDVAEQLELEVISERLPKGEKNYTKRIMRLNGVKFFDLEEDK